MLAKLMKISDQRKSRWGWKVDDFVHCLMFFEEENGYDEQYY
ncbi:hypothetical protein AT3G48298 [Arabidopsis thaliana]|uniref:Uncharacterized protein n=1 Tax=Arabidopsis thaliana TaxID=3702 RepID=B3H4X7_ARATH|nr:uncharacterized protein AT3G48298 [Arabidopsis thaliana]AEE78398.1 hypothetical protein AT3G48298 [Arabidopsis thaliana]|eukprot:NP_001118792.1 hypothetical protein AT3G48298 [Arabidopsis thaliana]